MTNFLAMEHARPTITVFVLLLSSIALEGFLAVAKRNTAVHDHTSFMLKSVEELPTKTSNKKWHRGRVMAMAEEVKDERRAMKAGADPSARKCGRGQDEKSSLGWDDKTSLSESLRLSHTKVSISSSTAILQNTANKASVKRSKFQEATGASSNHEFLRSWRKSEPSDFSRPIDFFHTNPEKHLLADKFYKMVNNDYNLRARRHPPVHN